MPMIFALLDYLRYSQRRGPYAPHKLEERGGKLATAQNFADEKYDAGDLFFLHTYPSALSWSVMYISNGPWSHSGMFVESGMIIDATTSGVVKHPFADYLDGQSYIATRRLPLSMEQRQLISESMHEHLGRGFNWRGVFHLGLLIITASTGTYRLRFAGDLAILLAPLLLVGAFIPTVWYASVGTALVYAAIVMFNLVRRFPRRTSQPEPLFAL